MDGLGKEAENVVDDEDGMFGIGGAGYIYVRSVKRIYISYRKTARTSLEAIGSDVFALLFVTLANDWRDRATCEQSALWSALLLHAVQLSQPLTSSRVQRHGAIESPR